MENNKVVPLRDFNAKEALTRLRAEVNPEKALATVNEVEDHLKSVMRSGGILSREELAQCKLLYEIAWGKVNKFVPDAKNAEVNDGPARVQFIFNSGPNTNEKITGAKSPIEPHLDVEKISTNFAHAQE